MARFADQRVLITGGAGFIGSRLSRALAAEGAQITIFDNLLEQVHGPSPRLDLPGELVVGDVRDDASLRRTVAASNPHIVVHLAAETGTGQSADEPLRYSDVNVSGTARLIEAMKAQETPPRRVLLAATRAVYGEGAYRTADGQIVNPDGRQSAAMAAGRFEVFDADGVPLEPVPTPVDLKVAPASVYGSTKLMQEYLLAQTPAPWSSVFLRLQNVYGPGQSLRNPYTGVLSIFAQQAMNGQTLRIFEDGAIVRDFVFVDDVVAAFVAAAAADAGLSGTFNVGTGVATSIHDAANWILEDLGIHDRPCIVSGDFRPGDIRHAVADIAPTVARLDWQPKVDAREGIRQLVAWAKDELRPAS